MGIKSFNSFIDKSYKQPTIKTMFDSSAIKDDINNHLIDIVEIYLTQIVIPKFQSDIAEHIEDNKTSKSLQKEILRFQKQISNCENLQDIIGEIESMEDVFDSITKPIYGTVGISEVILRDLEQMYKKFADQIRRNNFYHFTYDS